MRVKFNIFPNHYDESKEDVGKLDMLKVYLLNVNEAVLIYIIDLL